MDWDLILDARSPRRRFGPQAVVFALAAIGLNVHFGYTGLVNFGQVGFVAVGAYTMAMGVDTYGLSFWLAMFRVSSPRSLLALILGVPTLRLRADYLAIVTIAAGEIIRLVRSAPRSGRPPAGRAASRTSPATSSTSTRSRGPVSTSRTARAFTYSESDLGAAGRLVDRRAGSACSSTCSCAARGAGSSRPSARTRTPSAASARTSTPTRCSRLVIGGVIGGMGGIIFAVAAQSVVPDSLGTALTFFAYTALILGGAARSSARCSGRSSSSSSARSPTWRSARRSTADYINFLVGQRGRHRPAHPRRRRAHGCS